MSFRRSAASGSWPRRCCFPTREARLGLPRLGGHFLKGGYGVDHGRGETAEAAAAQLRPYLAEAMLASRSQYVFAAEDGSMRRGDTKLQAVLRRALARAGMVLGYRHVCPP